MNTNNQTQEITDFRCINSIDNTTDTIVKFQGELTDRDIAMITILNRLKNPFKMIGIDEVMKDLKVCRNVAYKIFQRDDFPAINIGKNKQVSLLAYILWKLERKEW